MAAKDTRVALIRGINVGKAKRVAMADLRAELEKIGYGDVRTLLNSGNVVFEAGRSKPANDGERIGKALLEKTGVAARVLVFDAAVLDEAIDDNPLLGVADDPSRLIVTFFRTAADRDRMAGWKATSPEMFAIGRHAAYLWCPSGLNASPLAEALHARVGDGVTSRNWATVLKLQALANGLDR